jgi:hypothetical protein
MAASTVAVVIATCYLQIIDGMPVIPDHDNPQVRDGVIPEREPKEEQPWPAESTKSFS